MRALILAISMLFSALSYAYVDEKELIKQIPTAELERDFWVCDFRSTQDVMSSGFAGYCSVVFEELKKRKFDGSYKKFHAWWQENREAKHKDIKKQGL